jgi:excinuclease ABC subunit C
MRCSTRREKADNSMPAQPLKKQLAQLPDATGLYLLRDRQRQALWLGVAEKLKQECNALFQAPTLPFIANVASVQSFPITNLAELPTRYRQLLMDHQPAANQSPQGMPSYAYLQLSDEAYPRLQVTRRPTTQAFGPVLPAHAMPDVIKRLAQIFRLRRCNETIDGGFSLPCLEYFRKRCLAPCVQEFCDASTYNAAVDDLRLLLRADEGWQGKWQTEWQVKMQQAVAREDFETAAQCRDVMQAGQQIRAHAEFVICAAELGDAFTLHDKNGAIAFHLLTRRKRKKMGELLFRWEDGLALPATVRLEHLLLWHYVGNLPREIKLPLRLPHQKLLQRSFDALSGGLTQLTATAKPSGMLARFAAQRAVIKNAQRLPKPETDAATELQHILNLAAPPDCIQSFDVAHLTGQHTVASVITWRAVEPETWSQRIYVLKGLSEPDAMQEAVRREAGSADLILVDGGKMQMRRAQAALPSGSPVLAAVKPPGQSHLIAHFLKPDESVLQLAPTAPASRLLYRLRNAAHAAANAAHRQLREAATLPTLTRLLPDLTEIQRRAMLQQCDSPDDVLKASVAQFNVVLGAQQARLTVQRLRRLRQQGDSSAKACAELPVVLLDAPCRY